MTDTTTVGALDTIPRLLVRNAEIYADKPAYREKEYGIWQSWTWAETCDEIQSLALGFLTLGVNPGDHIAIIGRNRPYFYWAMVAAQSVGAVPVPLYRDAVAEEMAYVLDHCSARFVVAEDQEQVDKMIDVMDDLETLEGVVFLDPSGMRKYDKSALFDYRELQQKGRDQKADLQAELDKRLAAQDTDTTCVMLYTSGTTGRPKGVVLSNRNIIETSKGTCEFDNLVAGDSVLAYMPMAWIGDFIFSIGQAYWSGFCVGCPESPETMQADLAEIGPTYFFAPPRYFEGLLTSVQIRMEDAGRFKQWLFKVVMAHAKVIGPQLLDGKSIGLLDQVKYWLGGLLITGPLKNTLGLSRVRVGYTAGEAIGPELFDFYRSLGINLKQLYGQTEASVFITQQPDGEVRADTVGTPSPGVELRIDDSGEVFYRSPGAFVKYYKNPQSTKDTKDPEGWVATGDAGFIEKDSGHLRIIDRAKDVGKLKDGSMFAPKFVENKLKFFANVLETVVFGSDKDTCVAFINIDLTAVGNWAERNNIAYSSYQELAAHPEVYKMIQTNVEEVNASVAQDEMLSGCQVTRFLILHKELDADDGELTRTQKVRRNIIAEKYDDLICALYDGITSISTETEVTYEDGRKGSISATLEIRDAATFARKKVAA
ncbi:MAG: AMP-binding protein [Proteobacteria bacterium]|nr:AMP-binding protein [Pseudomonadota bacterium]